MSQTSSARRLNVKDNSARTTRHFRRAVTFGEMVFCEQRFSNLALSPFE